MESPPPELVALLESKVIKPFATVLPPDPPPLWIAPPKAAVFPVKVAPPFNVVVEKRTKIAPPVLPAALLENVLPLLSVIPP